MTPFEKMRVASRIKLAAEALFDAELIDQIEKTSLQGDTLVADLAALATALEDLKAKSLEEKTEVAAAVAEIKGQVVTLQTAFDQFKADAAAGKVADAAAVDTMLGTVTEIKANVDDLSNLGGATPPPPPPDAGGGDQP